MLLNCQKIRLLGLSATEVRPIQPGLTILSIAGE